MPPSTATALRQNRHRDKLKASSKELPAELNTAEHGTLVTALIALEVQIKMSLDLTHWSPQTRAQMEVDLAAATTLREKLRLHYLVPIPRR